MQEVLPDYYYPLELKHPEQYTSRYLKRRNPVLHDKLQNLGDLDLLYFLVEDIVKPFETACMVSDKNPAEFNKICEYFFGGL
ncbi:hypothetical protein [Klebsiella pneumoniae]